jgi:hypothetical protein
MNLRAGIWVGLTLLVCGCTYHPQAVTFQDGPAGEIEKVLYQDQNIARQGGNMQRQGYHKADVVYWIVPRMKAIDTSDCPADFRMAYLEHCNAW